MKLLTQLGVHPFGYTSWPENTRDHPVLTHSPQCWYHRRCFLPYSAFYVGIWIWTQVLMYGFPASGWPLVDFRMQRNGENSFLCSSEHDGQKWARRLCWRTVYLSNRVAYIVQVIGCGRQKNRGMHLNCKYRPDWEQANINNASIQLRKHARGSSGMKCYSRSRPLPGRLPVTWFLRSPLSGGKTEA